MFRNDKIGLVAHRSTPVDQNFSHRDGVANYNRQAACDFQEWVEVSLSGDKQDYHVLQQVLKSIRGFDEKITMQDLQETYNSILEQDAYHNKQ